MVLTPEVLPAGFNVPEKVPVIVWVTGSMEVTLTVMPEVERSDLQA